MKLSWVKTKSEEQKRIGQYIFVVICYIYWYGWCYNIKAETVSGISYTQTIQKK